MDSADDKNQDAICKVYSNMMIAREIGAMLSSFFPRVAGGDQLDLYGIQDAITMLKSSGHCSPACWKHDILTLDDPPTACPHHRQIF